MAACSHKASVMREFIGPTITEVAIRTNLIETECRNYTPQSVRVSARVRLKAANPMEMSYPPIGSISDREILEGTYCFDYPD